MPVASRRNHRMTTQRDFERYLFVEYFDQCLAGKCILFLPLIMHGSTTVFFGREVGLKIHELQGSIEFYVRVT